MMINERTRRISRIYDRPSPVRPGLLIALAVMALLVGLALPSLLTMLEQQGAALAAAATTSLSNKLKIGRPRD